MAVTRDDANPEVALNEVFCGKPVFELTSDIGDDPGSLANACRLLFVTVIGSATAIGASASNAHSMAMRFIVLSPVFTAPLIRRKYSR